MEEVDFKKNIGIKEQYRADTWLSKAVLSDQPITSDFDYIIVGAIGITKVAVVELAEHLGISKKAMAEDVVNVSVKTIERKADTDKLDKKASSHAIELLRF